MQRIKTLTSVIVMLFAAACTTTSGEIKSFKKAGECRKAENLIKKKYSGQTQLYNTAMVYIECDGEKSKGLKTLKTLAAGEFMPAMARLIEFNVASSQMIKRYNTLKSIAAERRQASINRLLNYGRGSAQPASGKSFPKKIDNRCIQDGGTRMCYNRQSQRYGNSGDSSGISSPYSGVSGQTGISGMSSPYD